MTPALRRELHAQRCGLTAGDLAEIMKDRSLNAFTQAELLCTALPTHLKELAREHYRILILGERESPSVASIQVENELERLRSIGLERSVLESLSILPAYSLCIELTFTLSRPYLSRDDDAFYIVDNPVRKEKVFQVPYVAPTGWKGSFRAAATRDLIREMDNALPTPIVEDTAKQEELRLVLWSMRTQRILLFGNEKEAVARYVNDWLVQRLFLDERDASGIDKAQRLKALRQDLERHFENHLKAGGYRTDRVEGRKGRLHFFPTYFNRIGLEIINPHDRERGVGTNPIVFECVPAGTTGRFSLLYLPFDYPAFGSDPCVTPDESALKQQISMDLPVLAEAIQGLFTIYGFGAKTSSGYGTAEDQLVEPGSLILNARLPHLVSEAFCVKELEPYLNHPDCISDFIGADHSLKSQDEYASNLQQRRQNYNRQKKQLYKRVQRWWDSGGAGQYLQHKCTQDSPHTTLHFSRLSELPKAAHRLAQALNGGGEE